MRANLDRGEYRDFEDGDFGRISPEFRAVLSGFKRHAGRVGAQVFVPETENGYVGFFVRSIVSPNDVSVLLSCPTESGDEGTLDLYDHRAERVREYLSERGNSAKGIARAVIESGNVSKVIVPFRSHPFVDRYLLSIKPEDEGFPPMDEVTRQFMRAYAPNGEVLI